MDINKLLTPVNKTAALVTNQKNCTDSYLNPGWVKTKSINKTLARLERARSKIFHIHKAHSNAALARKSDDYVFVTKLINELKAQING